MPLNQLKQNVLKICGRQVQIGLQNPRSLLHLVWWNNVTHLGMRGFKEQHDCQLSDFTLTEQYIEYKERQTKNRQGDEQTATIQFYSSFILILEQIWKE